jgi:multidrug resistance protein, MATE family
LRGAGLELPLLLAVYMINYVMSMSTQIFCGQLGNLEAAFASLGNTGIQVFAYVLMVRDSLSVVRLCIVLVSVRRALLLLRLKFIKP